MKQTVQNRIDNLKALSTVKKQDTDFVERTSSVHSTNDNLSKSIRSKKDAEVFQNELKIAIKLAKR